MQIDKYAVGACQFRSTFGDAAKSVERMVKQIEEAVRLEPRTRLLVFPECATTGLPGPSASSRDSDIRVLFMEIAERVPGPTSLALGRIAKAFGIYVATGFVEADPVVRGVSYNSSMLIGPDGEVLTVHRKVHTDSEIFKPGSSIETVDTPLGKVGLSICYDFWFPEFMRIQVLQGCEVHINMTANQPVFGVGSTHFPVVRAAESGVFVISANRIGDDRPLGGLQYMGSSSIVGPLGEVLAMAGNTEEEIVFAEIDLERVKRSRAFLCTLRDIRDELYEVRLLAPKRNPSMPPPPSPKPRSETQESSLRVRA